VNFFETQSIYHTNTGISKPANQQTTSYSIAYLYLPIY